MAIFCRGVKFQPFLNEWPKLFYEGVKKDKMLNGGWIVSKILCMSLRNAISILGDLQNAIFWYVGHENNIFGWVESQKCHVIGMGGLKNGIFW